MRPVITTTFYIKRTVFSRYLGHDFEVRILLPPGHDTGAERYPVLYLNDGQDIEQLNIASTLQKMYAENTLQKILVVAICAVDRMNEYGSSSREDYQNRGNKAEEYGKFITRELMPMINADFYVLPDAANTAFAGFSLGALSAFDIVWNYPEKFTKVGVLSGSLWWRRRELNEKYVDNNDRILINMLKHSRKREGLKFWFQAGTLDEEYDRNNNGIIDSIDDTLDVISYLKKIGYADSDIDYFEVTYGRHDFGTWSYAMPQFLKWAFAKKM